jgi:hypothetical protein
MTAWILPALKAALPHVGTILSAAAPVFTKKSADVPSQDPTLQQQVAELQATAAKNDTYLKDLAIQMRTMLGALEQGAALEERRYRRLLMLCLATGIIGVVSLGLVLIVLLR